MINKIRLTIIALSAASCTWAQSIDNVLESIEHNNTELKSLQKSMESGCLDIKAQNNLEDPSVEYSPFFNKNISGLASSELVVSQSFDFPTVYAARNKSIRLQQNVLQQQYLTARRNILLNAKNLCLDIVYQDKKKEVIDIREKNADHLLKMFEKRLAVGDATILEVNKVKLDRMNIATEKTQIENARLASVQSLTALNNNIQPQVDGMSYPDSTYDSYKAIYDRAITGDLDIREAQATVSAAAQEIEVNKKNWIPKFDIGYRRNTDGSEASNGFMVGATFPIFSSRNKLKAAKARNESEQMRLDNVRTNTENAAKSKISQLKQLQKTISAYDSNLMMHTLELLRTAVEKGEISIIDYYNEAETIYTNLLSKIDLELQYQLLLADICKNEL